MLGAPVVIVATDPDVADAGDHTAARDLLRPCSPHAQTWEMLLERAGFVDIAPLQSAGDGDARFGLSAAVPS